MKNIKVNITNLDGKRSSTTLNFAICEKLHEKSVFKTPEEHKPVYKTTDEYVKGISDVAQSYTNYLLSVAVKSGYKGTDQYYLESNMIEELLMG